MDRRHVLFGLAGMLAGQRFAQPALAARSVWGVAWTKIPSVVIVSRSDDRRRQNVRDAVAFWNQTLDGIGTPFRFGAVSWADGAVSSEELKAMSARVLGALGPPDLPDSVRAVQGDVIVVLSDAEFISFAARWPSRNKAFIGIRSDKVYPLMLPNVAQNVIAHELGHAIGLGHNDHPSMLMCGRPAPCRPDAFASTANRFFPLTTGEKAALKTMYPASWKEE